MDGLDGERMAEAVAAEAEAQRALLDGDEVAGRAAFARAAAAYRASWEAAGPRAFGRLVGMLKAAVLAGDAAPAATYAREALGEDGDSPPSWYAVALAALIDGDDDRAARAAEEMRAGGDAFARAAAAIGALARGDREAYAAAVGAVVADFEAREAHLTGVPFADTALMLERLAEPRGIAARPRSALLPT